MFSNCYILIHGEENTSAGMTHTLKRDYVPLSRIICKTIGLDKNKTVKRLSCFGWRRWGFISALPPCSVATTNKKAHNTNHKDWTCVLGGDGGDRTHDLLNAIQALSQLSYAPECMYINIIL